MRFSRLLPLVALLLFAGWMAAQQQNYPPGALNATMQFCGTTVTCSHTALGNPQIVFGSAALTSGTPSTAVITGISPAFTSNTSYKCFPNDVTTITNAVNVVTYTSGSSFTINGPATVTDTVSYICAGN